jgi:hypothetical protein
VCFLVGVAGLFVLPQFLARNTYVSENALQHGLHDVSLGSFVLRSDKSSRRGDETWIRSFLANTTGLEVHVLDFGTLAIVRSPRGNAASTLLVSAHFEPDDQRGNVSAAFVAAKFAELLATSRNIGKDVLFLFTRRERGVQDLKRFLEAYHFDVDAPPFRRSGALQQGFHLDFSVVNGIRKVVIEVEGSRLPNLDMVNNFVRSASAKGIVCFVCFVPLLVRLKNEKGVPQRLMLTTRKFFFRVLASLPPRIAFFCQFFLEQAFGKESMHAVLNEWACDTITIASTGDGFDITFPAFLDGIEAAFRSVLSLQETLHQSFYFYLLPSPWLYVPIGDFMIVFALCFALFPVTLIWFYLFSDVSSENWSELELLGPFFVGVACWNAPQWIALILYGGSLLAALFLWPDRRQTRNDVLVLAALAYWTLSLVCCVLANFPLAIVGCVIGALQLLAWKTRSRVFFLFCDVFVVLFVLYGSNTPSLVGCVPFR